jgi:hypothetical protein
VIAPDMPLSDVPQLEIRGIRAVHTQPRMPNGTLGAMPAFSTPKIPDEKAKALHDCIVNVTVKHSRKN